MKLKIDTPKQYLGSACAGNRSGLAVPAIPHVSVSIILTALIRSRSLFQTWPWNLRISRAGSLFQISSTQLEAKSSSLSRILRSKIDWKTDLKIKFSRTKQTECTEICGLFPIHASVTSCLFVPCTHSGVCGCACTFTCVLVHSHSGQRPFHTLGTSTPGKCYWKTSFHAHQAWVISKDLFQFSVIPKNLFQFSCFLSLSHLPG